MTVTRTQGIERISATAVNAAFTAFDIPRPQTTPQEVAYAENTDHVVREPALREFESGHCVIDLGTNLVAANVFLDKVEIFKLLPVAQKGLSSLSGSGLNSPPGGSPPLFPSGAPSDETFVRTLVDRAEANDLATNEDAVAAFLGQTAGNDTVRSYPGLTLRSGEFVRVTLGNTSGGDLTDTITATYKLGLSQSDTGKP